MRDDIAKTAAPHEGKGGEPGLTALHARICGDLRARSAWLERQTRWYMMRHKGIRRGSKPFPTAADLHFPLADSIIEKLKPFYFNQLFATETVAQFIAAQPELAPLASELGAWYDYKLKQQSNLEPEILVGIDKMLMTGHVPVKVYWDWTGSPQGRLAFDAIEPQHCIVPDGTNDLEKADRVTLVHQLSVEQYRRDPRFPRQDTEFLSRICGRGTGAGSGDDAALRGAVERREGITHAENPAIVIVWEIWEQTAEGWMVHWISPLAPEKPLRPSQRNPFRHGRLPIVRLEAEIKEKGHYASRGICERVETFERSLCKAWNEKTDYMTFCNRPLFTSALPMPNPGNFRMLPGQMIPGGLQAVTMQAPPVSFDQEMTSTRTVAEYNLGIPDYSLAENQDKGGRRTATEIHQVAGLMNVTLELRGRTFRIGLSRLLRLAWSTLVQYDTDTAYHVLGQLRTLPEAALREEAWRIEPAGTNETWNRAAQMQRAIQRKQLFAGAPWIDQRELDRSILELDDPQLVKRLLLPAGGAAQAPAATEANHFRADAPAGPDGHAASAQLPGAGSAGVPMPPPAASLSTATPTTSANASNQ